MFPTWRAKKFPTYFYSFFIIKRINRNTKFFLKAPRLFLLKRTSSLLGDVYSMRKLKSGDLLVEVSSANQSHIV